VEVHWRAFCAGGKGEEAVRIPSPAKATTPSSVTTAGRLGPFRVLLNQPIQHVRVRVSAPIAEFPPVTLDAAYVFERSLRLLAALLVLLVRLLPLRLCAVCNRVVLVQG
jgi:hypothetical protein